MEYVKLCWQFTNYLKYIFVKFVGRKRLRRFLEIQIFPNFEMFFRFVLFLFLISSLTWVGRLCDYSWYSFWNYQLVFLKSILTVFQSKRCLKCLYVYLHYRDLVQKLTKTKAECEGVNRKLDIEQHIKTLKGPMMRLKETLVFLTPELYVTLPAEGNLLSIWPPENCHLNVKKLPKTWHLKNGQKISCFPQNVFFWNITIFGS